MEQPHVVNIGRQLRNLFIRKQEIISNFNNSLITQDFLPEYQQFFLSLKQFHNEIKRIEREQVNLMREIMSNPSNLISISQNETEGETIYNIFQDFWGIAGFRPGRQTEEMELLIKSDFLWILSFQEGQEFISALIDKIQSLNNTYPNTIRPDRLSNKLIVFYGVDSKNTFTAHIGPGEEINEIQTIKTMYPDDASAYIAAVKEMDDRNELQNKTSSLKTGQSIIINLDRRLDTLYLKATKMESYNFSFLEYSPRIINILHEMYHALRTLEDHYAKYVEVPSLIQSLYLNFEELYVIAIGRYSENLFRKTIDIHERLTHYGVMMDLSEARTSSDERDLINLLQLSLYAAVESKMASIHFTELNQIQQIEVIDKLNIQKAGEYIQEKKKMQDALTSDPNINEFTKLLVLYLKVSKSINSDVATLLRNKIDEILKEPEKDIHVLQKTLEDIKKIYQAEIDSIIRAASDLYLQIKANINAPIKSMSSNLFQEQGSSEALVEHTFTFTSNEATTVHVAGNFNHWLHAVNGKIEGDHAKWKMIKGKNNTWKLPVKLNPDTYEFKYIIDNNIWMNDPNPFYPQSHDIYKNSILRVIPSTKQEALTDAKTLLDNIAKNREDYQNLYQQQQALKNTLNVEPITDYSILNSYKSIDANDPYYNDKKQLYETTLELVELHKHYVSLEANLLKSPDHDFYYSNEPESNTKYLLIEGNPIYFDEQDKGSGGWCAFYAAGINQPEQALLELKNHLNNPFIIQYLVKSLENNYQASLSLHGIFDIQGNDSNNTPIAQHIQTLYQQCQTSDQQNNTHAYSNFLEYLGRPEVLQAYLDYLLKDRYADAIIIQACLSLKGEKLVLLADYGLPDGRLSNNSADDVDIYAPNTVCIIYYPSNNPLLAHYTQARPQPAPHLVSTNSTLENASKKTQLEQHPEDKFDTGITFFSLKKARKSTKVKHPPTKSVQDQLMNKLIENFEKYKSSPHADENIINCINSELQELNSREDTIFHIQFCINMLENDMTSKNTLS